MADINNIMNSQGATAALNTGGDIISSLINNIWADARATKQYNRSIEMWNMQNEYDTPSAQLQRLRDAGLNPLYFGLDGNSSNAMAAPQMAASPAFTNPIAAGLEGALSVAQRNNLQADTALKGKQSLTETKRYEEMEQKILNEKQELENLKKQGDLTQAEIDQIDKAMQWYDRIQEANIAYTQSMTALNDSQKKRIDELLEGEKLLQTKTIEDFDHKWAKIRAEIGLIAKQTGLAEKDIENYALNHMQGGIFNSGISLPNIRRNRREKGIGDNTQGINQNAPEGADFMPANYGVKN